VYRSLRIVNRLTVEFAMHNNSAMLRSGFFMAYDACDMLS